MFDVKKNKVFVFYTTSKGERTLLGPKIPEFQIFFFSEAYCSYARYILSGFAIGSSVKLSSLAAILYTLISHAPEEPVKLELFSSPSVVMLSKLVFIVFLSPFSCTCSIR